MNKKRRLRGGRDDWEEKERTKRKRRRLGGRRED